MKSNQIIGIVVFAIGIGVLVFAFRSADSPMERLSDTFTGRYSNETMAYFAIGIAAAIGGGLLAFFGSRK